MGKPNQVNKYIKEVLSGKIITNKYVKLACERHLSDLQNANKLGIFFDYEAAQYVIDFFKNFLVHSKGEWAESPFTVAAWEAFILSSVFGWKRKSDNKRRFRIAYISVPRKNGKTTLAAGIGLYLFVADNEIGAEIYTAGTKLDQAKIAHSEATRMVKASQSLLKLIGVFKNNLHIESTQSKYEPLGADADTMDGLNVHGAIIDELHAHKNRLMWDVLDTATTARQQPLLLAITTAGSNRNTICWEQHEYAQKILNGVVKDETFFCFLSSADEEDDWTKETTWIKANPNYGISVKPDDLKRKCEKAKQSPASQNAFMRLHLNRWTQQVDRWIDLQVWQENNTKEISEADLIGRRCYGGLDLSSISDITAWVMVFPDDEDSDKIDVLARLWCPEDRLHDKTNRYYNDYQTWHRQGFLETTPGNCIDYSFIKAKILEDAQRFQLVDMNIDRLFQAHQISMELIDEGINVVGMGMGYMSFAAPMKEFERRLLARKINHGGNPVLKWMADNVAVSIDPAGNLKPNKAESQGKVDGIVALILAIDRLSRGAAGGTSVYEERGLISVEV